MKILILCVLLLTSCSVTIKNFEKYEKAPLLQLEDMPTKDEVSHSIPRVVVTASEPKLERISQTNAHNVVKNRLVTLLSTEKFASIVERSINAEAQKEKEIAELEGKVDGSLKSADYILEVEITDIAFSSKLKSGIDPLTLGVVAGAMIIEGKNGNTMYSAQHLPNAVNKKYEYKYSVDGNIKVYQMPTMTLLTSIPLKGESKDTELATVDSHISSAFLNMRISETISAKEQDQNLAYKAINKAIEYATPEIKTFLKKKGYIMEKRVFKDNAIYEINRGTQHGVKSQDKLSITRQETQHNALTDEDDIIEKKICTGIVAKNTLSTTRAWAVFEKSCHENLRLGDIATFQYK